MDKSKRYILMCRKAKKLQDNYSLFSKSNDTIIFDHNLDGECSIAIWLPRVDQLQNMVLQGDAYKWHHKLERFNEYLKFINLKHIHLNKHG